MTTIQAFSLLHFQDDISVNLSFHNLFLMSFSSLRMREDSCSGVGALNREGPLSAPDGGVGSLCLNSSSMLLCSLRFRPFTATNTNKHKKENSISSQEKTTLKTTS